MSRFEEKLISFLVFILCVHAVVTRRDEQTTYERADDINSELNLVLVILTAALALRTWRWRKIELGGRIISRAEDTLR